jgi:hypothetical protein
MIFKVKLVFQTFTFELKVPNPFKINTQAFSMWAIFLTISSYLFKQKKHKRHWDLKIHAKYLVRTWKRKWLREILIWYPSGVRTVKNPHTSESNESLWAEMRVFRVEWGSLGSNEALYCRKNHVEDLKWSNLKQQSSTSQKFSSYHSK